MPNERPNGAAWQDSLAGGLRKVPVQARSRATVKAVLDAAAELVEELGFEAVVESPTLILDRSGVSRGSFYSFFETPERVLDQLAYQQILQFVAGIEKRFRSREGAGWRGVIDVLVDYYLEVYAQPLIRELWVRQNITSRVRHLDEAAIEDIAELLRLELIASSDGPQHVDHIQCVVAVHALERLCQFAFANDPHGDQEVIGEARELLVAYFSRRPSA
ncbi:TetR/AcrR family transcriptional regulator [Nocardia cyriacigeorgica]|uniref:TetR/AcrR family transcriptional regulator n=1 Tax=Nocardia cyriacigeorgica TaxID=135487 RepID=UPI002457FE9A|nr:TetR/AcrR family transcriptional regulator [Nocardia cyriacigeorgica]